MLQQMNQYEAHEKRILQLRKDHDAELEQHQQQHRGLEREVAESRREVERMAAVLDAQRRECDGLRTQACDLQRELERVCATESALRVRTSGVSLTRGHLG
jgi:chromosome segregation ATPase